MNIELDYSLKLFLGSEITTFGSTYKTCANCNKECIKVITLTLLGNCLYINTFCSNFCIKAIIVDLYSGDNVVYLSINCNSFMDSFNKKLEINQCIKKLSKVSLLT